MNILRALFLNNSNKDDTNLSKTTTDQSIEFMSKFNLRILCWELRINYHKNQQTASALPAPIQKWLKEQQQQYPHADWIMDRVEKSILDEIKDTPSIKQLARKAADQKNKKSAKGQTKVSAAAESIDRRLELPSVPACPARNSFPLGYNQKNPFYNFDNTPFDKQKILMQLGVVDGAASVYGSSFEEEIYTPSNGFSGSPRDCNDVIIKQEEEDGDAPVAHNSAARLIAPLAPVGAPGIAAADAGSSAAIANPLPHDMVIYPFNAQYNAASDHYPAHFINNNDNIWQPFNGFPAGQPRHQYVPVIKPAYVHQQQQQKPAYYPTGEGFQIIGAHPHPHFNQPPTPPYYQQRYQQQQHFDNRLDNRQYQYRQAPYHYQPVVSSTPFASGATPQYQETEQKMRLRYQKYYNNYYQRHYGAKLQEYQRQCQQPQPPAPQPAQLLVKQQHQEKEQEETANSSIEDININAAELGNLTIHKIERIHPCWHTKYIAEFGGFCNAIMSHLSGKFVLGQSSQYLECVNTVGNGVNGDIHVVKYFKEPLTGKKPIQYVMKRAKFANYLECQRTKIIGKKMALHLGAEEEVFGLSLDHPNLMKLFQVFIDPIGLHLEIIMPRMSASLSRMSAVLRQEDAFPYHENTVWYIMHEFLQGLAYLHKKGRFHGDIKPANVLVSRDGEIKLTDFGLCGRVDEVCYNLRGTPFYLAPEVAATEYDNTACYGVKSDMYSTGILMYELLMGDPASEDCPFDSEGLSSEEGWKWQASRNPVITRKDVTRQYKELLAWLLDRDPESRPSPSVLLNDSEYFRFFAREHNRQAMQREFSNLVRIYSSFDVMNKV
ncbi:hypothetical protein PS6_010457 [Mucor atramentarius]